MEQKQLEFFDKRNKLLIALIKRLDLGIHILHLPEKPMFYSRDYSIEYSGFVLNKLIILNSKPHDNDKEESIRIKLSDELLESEEKIEQIRFIFQDWINNCTHREVYTVKVKDMRLYLTGYNHHDKLNKENPYPVFSQFYPKIFYDIEKKQEIIERFSGKIELV